MEAGEDFRSTGLEVGGVKGVKYEQELLGHFCCTCLKLELHDTLEQLCCHCSKIFVSSHNNFNVVKL